MGTLTLPFGNPSPTFADDFTRRGEAVQAVGGADAWNSLSPTERLVRTQLAGIDPARIDFTADTGDGVFSALGDLLKRISGVVSGGATDQLFNGARAPVPAPGSVPQFASGGSAGAGGSLLLLGGLLLLVVLVVRR